MFPLRDTVRSRHLPVMTFLLIVANGAVFAWEILLPEAAAVRVFAGYGLVPARILGPAHTGGLLPPGAGLSTLLTSMFLYAGWLHVIMNLWTLWIFGDNVEALSRSAAANLP
jgi:membrane associated rhomboid family serine protease